MRYLFFVVCYLILSASAFGQGEHAPADVAYQDIICDCGGSNTITNEHLIDLSWDRPISSEFADLPVVQAPQKSIPEKIGSKTAHATKRAVSAVANYDVFQSHPALDKLFDYGLPVVALIAMTLDGTASMHEIGNIRQTAKGPLVSKETGVFSSYGGRRFNTGLYFGVTAGSIGASQLFKGKLKTIHWLVDGVFIIEDLMGYKANLDIRKTGPVIGRIPAVKK